MSVALALKSRIDVLCGTPATEHRCVAVCCSVLQCVPVYCSVLQCVATLCSVLRVVLYVIVCDYGSINCFPLTCGMTHSYVCRARIPYQRM